MHAPPCVGGAVWTQGMFLPYSGHVLLPTKTLWAFSQFPDNSLFIVFHCCGYIWWCLVVYSIVYMLLVFFSLTVWVRAVCTPLPLSSAKKNLLTTALQCLIMPYWLSKA